MAQKMRTTAAFACIFLYSLYLTDARTLKFKSSTLPPVILVPGDGGSQFEARLNKTTAPHIWCDKVTDYWFSLWLNLELMAPYILDCTVDNLRLMYSTTTRKTTNNVGVEIRQPGFGNTSSVEWLDPSQFSPTAYYNPIVDALVSLGYTKNVNIRGAPYDFRRAPNEQLEYLSNLKKLAEETYTLNGNTRVILMGHSMGNAYLLYFLNQQSQAWKDKYVDSMFSLAGPYAGAAKILRLMASGDNLDVFVVNPLTARPEQRSMPSSAWLMPYDTFWSSDEVIVTGPTRNYTVNDYEQFFKDVNFTTGWEMRKDTEHLIKKLTPPGVEVYCMHGTNVSTPTSFTYTSSTWYGKQPETLNSDGDGTVNIRSLHACLRWQGKQKQTIYHKELPTVTHMGILASADAINYIKQVIQGKADMNAQLKYKRIH